MGDFAAYSATDLIERLQLAPHPTEGGYFRRTYASDTVVDLPSGHERASMSSIYYLLTREADTGCWHRNRSDILHYWHGVGVIEYRLISPSGALSCYRLGGGLLQGEQLQLCVPRGYWKHARLVSGDYCLLSEAVTPGFDFADNQVATDQHVRKFEARFSALRAE